MGEFTDDELLILETALMCYRNQVIEDAGHEPDLETALLLAEWAFKASELMLKLDIDPVEASYELRNEGNES